MCTTDREMCPEEASETLRLSDAAVTPHATLYGPLCSVLVAMPLCTQGSASSQHQAYQHSRQMAGS